MGAFAAHCLIGGIIKFFNLLFTGLTLILVLTTLNKAYADEGFFTTYRLRERRLPVPENLDNALRSSVRVLIGNGMTMNCSAQFISNDGYLLTALHCLDTTLEVYNLFRMASFKLENATWVEVGAQVPAQPTFVSLRTFIPGWGPYHGFAQAIFLGRGFGGNFPDYQRTSGWDSSVEARQAIATHAEDFLILKLDLKGRSVSCVPVAEAMPSPGAPVWAVGFPEAASRRYKLSSNGRSRYVTYGHINSSLAENQLVRAQNLPPAVVAEFNQFFLPASRFLSSLDSWVGMSGGMVLDSLGRLIGTIARGGSSALAYEDASTDAMRVSYILEKARMSLDAPSVSRIFDCHDFTNRH